MKIDKAIGQNDLYPIYGMIKKPFWQTGMFKGIIFCAVLLVLFFIIYIIFKKLKKRKPKLNACQQALLDVENLRKNLLTQKINGKDFYLRLTEILKKYMFCRFSYDLFGFTDSEMIKYLDDNSFDRNLLENIKEMLLSVQVIKFANAKAALELMIRDLDTCKNLINLTSDKNNTNYTK